MTIKKIRRRLPALYRWSRRRRYFPHAVLVLCTILFLPVGIVGGAKISNMISANNALAATRAVAPEHSVVDIIPEEERARYGSTLIGLILDDPKRLDSLIGNDFLVMFNEPELKRQEGAVHVWQYRTSSCVLDLFMNGTVKTVDYYEIRSRKIALFAAESSQEGTVDITACLQEIYDQRAI